MADTPDRARVKVYPCPNCRETINNLATVCPFCATPVDPAAVDAAVAETSRVSAACSDASLLRNTAWTLLAALGISFIPFIGTAGGIAYFCLSFVLPFMALRWWIKYGRLQTQDPDFAPARRAAMLATVAGVVSLVAVFPVLILTHMRALPR